MMSCLGGTLIGGLLVIIVILVGELLMKKVLIDREKSSAFECGFDPLKQARLPFSMRFFLLAIIFLIFDIEIALLLPLLISMGSKMSIYLMLGGLVFLLVVFLGLCHEWNEGSLNWSE